jgi:ribosome-binding factor A
MRAPEPALRAALHVLRQKGRKRAMPAHRKEKLSSLVREVVSEIISRKLNDPRIEPLTTVTRVELTGDLAVAKVFLSVTADDAAERRTLAAIRHAAGFMQRILAGQLTLRQCPQLQFQIDAGAKAARRTIELIEQNRREREDQSADDEQDPVGDQ